MVITNATAANQDQLHLQQDEGLRIYETTEKMDEDLKNQVIKSFEEIDLKEFKNKYTVFLGVTFHNLLEDMLNIYRNITTTDIKAINQQMNNPIESSLTIDKYFKFIDDCIQYANYGKTPYTAPYVIHNVHHVVLVAGLYVNACK